jgi:hypothetical protein
MNSQRCDMRRNVLFDVVEKPVLVDDQRLLNRKAIINADTNQVLGIVSNEYVPVPNKQLLDYFDVILQKSKIRWNMGRGHLLEYGKKTIIEMRFPDINTDIDDDDVIQLRGYLINSVYPVSAEIKSQGSFDSNPVIPEVLVVKYLRIFDILE